MKKPKSLDEIPDSSCSCDICRNMCRRMPCWPIPKDVEKLIDAGYGDRLMLEWREDETISPNYIELIVPAEIHHEGRQAPFFPLGHCNFLKDGLCELHDPGLKPTEGRKAIHGKVKTDEHLHRMVIESWDNSEGRNTVAKWKKLHYKGPMSIDETVSVIDKLASDELMKKFEMLFT